MIVGTVFGTTIENADPIAPTTFPEPKPYVALERQKFGR